MCVFVDGSMCVGMYVCMCIICVYVYLCMCACVYAYSCLYACVHACMSACSLSFVPFSSCRPVSCSSFPLPPNSNVYISLFALPFI